jgi:hypothetical protein
LKNKSIECGHLTRKIQLPVPSGRDAPDTVFAGYPVRAGYRISGRISGKGRIPDIRPDTLLDNYIFGQMLIKVIKSAFKNYRLLQTLNKA